MKQRIALAWHVLRGRPLIYRATITAGQIVITEPHAKIVASGVPGIRVESAHGVEIVNNTISGATGEDIRAALLRHKRRNGGTELGLT